eukprot:gene17805-23414_t
MFELYKKGAVLLLLTDKLDVADGIRVSASVIRYLFGRDEDPELIGSKAMKDSLDIILDSVAGHKEMGSVHFRTQLSQCLIRFLLRERNREGTLQGYGKVSFMDLTLRSRSPVDETIYRRSARFHEELRQPFCLNIVDKRSPIRYKNVAQLPMRTRLTGVGIVLAGRDSEGTFKQLNCSAQGANQSNWDSKTSLKWSKNEHYRGERVRRASIAYTIIGSLFDYDVVETVHAGIENVLCDGLSRDHNRSVQEQISGMGYVPVSEELSSEVTKLLNMCNPNSPLGSDQEFRTFWEGFIDGTLN